MGSRDEDAMTLVEGNQTALDCFLDSGRDGFILAQNGQKLILGCFALYFFYRQDVEGIILDGTADDLSFYFVSDGHQIGQFG
ncbi:hypothetical protein SDC9_106201 [bioreactor metagenome]|uniref:Uncharacterized protein n=1 Tax=bioreactor metagenome TaxID=1076179 RepID=A0A645B460_9ZZZZ